MTLYLVRHAHAGDRAAWKGPDEQRPLSPKGHKQARRLVELLENVGVTSIRSSPAVRCVETVEPLAVRLALDIEIDADLFEGAHPEIVLTLARAAVVGGGSTVFSTHGDVIPDLLDGLADRDDIHLPDAYPCAKGSTWVLEDDGHGRFVSARYMPGR